MWNLKYALKCVLKEYNQRRHSTTKMTPNEAYLQKYIQTEHLQENSVDEIRNKVIDSTKAIGLRINMKCIKGTENELKVGDPLLVKTSMRIKIRSDGTHLIIPSI